MITLEATRKIQGIAGAATTVTITLEGMELNGATETYKVLAQAQLGNSIGDVYVAGAGVTGFIRTILLLNTSNTATCTVVLYNVLPPDTAGNTNEIYSVTLPAGGSAVYDNEGWIVYDFVGNPQNTTRNVPAVSFGGNTFGQMATTGGGSLYINAGSGMTLNQSGNSLSINAADPTNVLTLWDNMGTTASSSSAVVPQRLYVFPLCLNDRFPGNMTVNTMNWEISGSVSGNTNVGNGACTAMLKVGLYTFNAGTLSLLNSAAYTLFSNGATTYNVCSMSQYMGGIRWAQLTAGHWSQGGLTLSSSRYWIGYFIAISSGANTSTAAFGNGTFNMLGQTWYKIQTRSGTFGANSFASNGTKGCAPFFGAYTAAVTNAFPNAIVAADINKTTYENFVPHIQLNNALAVF